MKICEICGTIEAEDNSLEIYTCKYNHNFCKEHLDGKLKENIPLYISKDEAIITLSTFVMTQGHLVEINKKKKDLSSKIKEHLDRDNKLLSEIKLLGDISEKEWEDFAEANDLNNKLFYKPFEHIPQECCPLCTLKEISNSDKINYLLSKFGMTDKQLQEEIQKNFSNLEDLKKYNHI